MKALISMDFVSLKKTWMLAGIFGVIICVASIINGRIYIVAPVCAYMALVLTATSYMSDCKVKFQQYLFSMPINKKVYIFSKLFYAALFGLIGGGLTFGYLFLENVTSLNLMILTFFIILEAILLCSTIQLTLFIKFGAEKGQLIMVITYTLFFVIITILKERKSLFSMVLQTAKLFPMLILGIALLLIVAVCILVLIKISIKILEKKEY